MDTEVQENKKYYTIDELSQILQVTAGVISHRVANYRLPVYKYGKKNLYDENTLIKLKELLNDDIQTNNSHPLVTNPLFLKTEYFPDVIPNCFKSRDIYDDD